MFSKHALFFRLLTNVDLISRKSLMCLILSSRIFLMINTRFLLTPNEQQIEATRRIQVFWQRLSHLCGLYNLSTKTLALISVRTWQETMSVVVSNMSYTALSIMLLFSILFMIKIYQILIILLDVWGCFSKKHRSTKWKKSDHMSVLTSVL